MFDSVRDTDPKKAVAQTIAYEKANQGRFTQFFVRFVADGLYFAGISPNDVILYSGDVEHAQAFNTYASATAVVNLITSGYKLSKFLVIAVHDPRQGD